MDILETIQNGEGDELEFKLVPNEDRAKYLKTALAFANGKKRRRVKKPAASQLQDWGPCRKEQKPVDCNQCIRVE